MSPWELKEACAQGRNLMELLRERGDLQGNREHTIELSYDLQAGSYIRHVETVEGREQRRKFGAHLAEVLHTLGPVSSLLEAGVGEATTLWHVLTQLPQPPRHIHGFDLSWSRVACAARWLAGQTPRFDVMLSTASLRELRYKDNSFDVICTAHRIEPNRGREEEILSELYRVASRHLVLLEPAYEFVSAGLRARMDQHGYCRGLAETARSRGYDVTRHELFAGSGTPQNPTSLLIIAKNPTAPPATPHFACPVHGTPLARLPDCFYSEPSMRAYPILGGIPCLRREAGIIASKLGEFISGQA
jgi:hypothetical protein